MPLPHEMRRRRISELAQWLHDSPGGRSDLKRVRGKGAYLWGVKEKKISEYVEALENAGLVAVEKNVIVWVGKE